MPRKPTPAGKQRVRTGCLTCRKRRRKCDEQKPRCANCEVKGFTCKYGADLAFVPPRSGEAGVGAGQAYGTITVSGIVSRVRNVTLIWAYSSWMTRQLHIRQQKRNLSSPATMDHNRKPVALQNQRFNLRQMQLHIRIRQRIALPWT